MPIALLTTAAWVNEGSETEVMRSPAWMTVEASIRALDGIMRDHLILQPRDADPETWLAIGGGDGRYVVTGSKSGVTFPLLSDPGALRTPPVLLQVGGQPSEYDRDLIVSLDMALKAARAFFDAGSFECGVAWSNR